MNKKGFAPLIILVVVAAVVVIGGIGWVHYIYLPQMAKERAAASVVATPTSTTQSSTAPYVATGHATGTYASSGINISLSADEQTTINCGTATCFDEHFAACTPATQVTDIGFAAMSFKIVGPVSGGCSVQETYTKNPNPAWMNQIMTCTLNNKIDFLTAQQNTLTALFQKKGGCTGALVDIMLTPPKQ